MVNTEKLIPPVVATELLFGAILCSLGAIPLGILLTLAGTATILTAIKNNINSK